jgi:hypothetical protein
LQTVQTGRGGGMDQEDLTIRDTPSLEFVQDRVQLLLEFTQVMS